jgi:glycosyltransferase involved in cell wall biosynthesis
MIETTTDRKPKLWICIDWFLPAYKAGGPIQSIANLVNRLKADFEISIVTSNSDLGEPLVLDSKAQNVWIQRDGYRVMYIDSAHQNKAFYKTIFKKETIDVIYFNSLFSVKFTLLPLLMVRHFPIRKVLAPRGMLGQGALAIKPLKKRLFLKGFQLFNLHKKVLWHATAESEVDEIKQHFGSDRAILLAPNLSAGMKADPETKHKKENEIRLFFLSRISIKKNLLGALELLSKLNSSYSIRFSIIGPIDDRAYWQKCEDRIAQLPNHITVHYEGSIPNADLPKRLKEEHLLLLPTFHENFGHVIMEAWQNGCPVIISDQTPWRNLDPKKLGYDLALSNEEGFIKAIEQFAEMSQSTYEEWSEAAFKHAKAFTENPEVLEKNKALFLGASIEGKMGKRQ